MQYLLFYFSSKEDSTFILRPLQPQAVFHIPTSIPKVSSETKVFGEYLYKAIHKLKKNPFVGMKQILTIELANSKYVFKRLCVKYAAKLDVITSFVFLLRKAQ